MSKENWSAKENIVVSGFKIEGHVLTTSGSPVPNALVELHFSDESYSKIKTDKFACDLSSRSKLLICHVKTDSAGKFVFSNVGFGKYRLSAILELENTLFQFSMKPDYINVDLTNHQDVLLSESFQLEKVTISSQALLSKDVKHFSIFVLT